MYSVFFFFAVVIVTQQLALHVTATDLKQQEEMTRVQKSNGRKMGFILFKVKTRRWTSLRRIQMSVRNRISLPVRKGKRSVRALRVPLVLHRVVG